MADLAGITAVRPTVDTAIERVKYGATVAPGQTVYLDSADGEYKLADADVAANAAAARGVAITPGVDGGYGLIAIGGGIILVGTTMTVGAMYVGSDTAGGIKPNADLTTGDFVTNLGRASSATQLELDINATGIEVP